MSSTVTMISGRQSQRGQMVITETRRWFNRLWKRRFRRCRWQGHCYCLRRSFLHPTRLQAAQEPMPFYHRALGHWLEYELTYNDYNSVIQAMSTPNTTSEAYLSSTTWSLCQSWPEWLTTSTKAALRSCMTGYCGTGRWQWTSLTPSGTSTWTCPPAAWRASWFSSRMLPRNNPSLATLRPFTTPKQRKWKLPSREFYSQGIRAYQMWDEAKKYFAASIGSKRQPDVGTIAKDPALADVNLGEFLTCKYSLWLELRTSDDAPFHGSGAA